MCHGNKIGHNVGVEDNTIDFIAARRVSGRANRVNSRARLHLEGNFLENRYCKTLPKVQQLNEICTVRNVLQWSDFFVLHTALWCVSAEDSRLLEEQFGDFQVVNFDQRFITDRGATFLDACYHYTHDVHGRHGDWIAADVHCKTVTLYIEGVEVWLSGEHLQKQLGRLENCVTKVRICYSDLAGLVGNTTTWYLSGRWSRSASSTMLLNLPVKSSDAQMSVLDSMCTLATLPSLDTTG